MREPRSIIFYAWAGLAAQLILAAGVIAFVLAGSAAQRSAIEELRGKVQAVQVGNLAMVTHFLDAQRAIAGYQATGERQYLADYSADRREFTNSLSQVRRLASSAVIGDVLAEERSARSAFRDDDQAVAAPAGSRTAARLYAQASRTTSTFTSQADALGRLLTRNGNALTASSERILSVGLGWTAAILAVGLMLPVIAGAAGLRWVSGPIHAVTTTIRKRAAGDRSARVVPGGPADVRELAQSLNFLADEGNRRQTAEEERARLLAEVRRASVRIREHLRGEAIIQEAVTAIHEHLAVGFVWVGMINGDRITLAQGDLTALGEAADIVGYFSPDSVGWIRDVYRHRSSYRVQDLHAQAAEIPAEIRKILLSQGATSLLLTPFGVPQELLGCLILLRDDPGRVWTEPEIEAAESLASDIGRGLEHARLYEREERLVAELTSVDRAKASFLASASHDLRTPLTSIIGYVELLSDGEAGPVQPAQAKMLDGVERNARRLKTMIEDMLTMSKIELGAFASRLHPVDLAGLVPAAVDVMRPAAAAGGLRFEVSCPDHGLMIDGDPEQLDRVLINLLSNAVKYTPRGGRITLTAGSADDSALVTVTDTGIGIPEKDQGHLFTRFFRASNAVEAAIQGSGLGLSIVRTIVANHHGDLSLESVEDRGTTVTVRIPLLSAAPPAGPDGEQPSRTAHLTGPGGTAR
jgi:two-component system, OmpR family, phosphate regulon sensor histidine kinase PhoR